MKRSATTTLAYIIAAAIGSIVTIAIYTALHPPSAPDRAADQHIQTHAELVHEYQSALGAANRTIDDMNLDITTAQSTESLEDLEAYVDSIPLRDTIAHPRID